MVQRILCLFFVLIILGDALMGEEKIYIFFLIKKKNKPHTVCCPISWGRGIFSATNKKVASIWTLPFLFRRELSFVDSSSSHEHFKSLLLVMGEVKYKVDTPPDGPWDSSSELNLDIYLVQSIVECFWEIIMSNQVNIWW